MKYWIYKCNRKRQPYAKYTGNWWQDFFEPDVDREWGSTEVVEALSKLKKGDRIIAHQTDKNELVGLAEVVGFHKRGSFSDVIMRPREVIRVKVRPLKKSDTRIDKIDALKGGKIQTLYEITNADAEYYLRKAGSVIALAATSSSMAVGGGFGDAEENKKVENAAMAIAKRRFKADGWFVQDVHHIKGLGHDLLCAQKGAVLHVEVKGSRGCEPDFLMTACEYNRWQNDPDFVLAFVGDALGKRPAFQRFDGPATSKAFSFDVIKYAVKRR